MPQAMAGPPTQLLQHQDRGMVHGVPKAEPKGRRNLMGEMPAWTS